MSNETKTCPACGNEIKAEARICRFCRARFEVVEKGYCTNCHTVVEADEGGKCRQCGGEVIDRHMESKLSPGPAALPLQPPPPRPVPAAAPPPRKGRGGWWVLAVVLALALCCCALVVCGGALGAAWGVSGGIPVAGLPIIATAVPTDTPTATPPPTAPPATPAPTGSGPSGQLVIGTTDQVTMLDPAGSYDIATWEVLHNTGDTLLVYQPGTADLIPGLAQDMPQVDSDGKSYVFKLRPGLRFNDGTPCDAHAVVWSIERVMRLNGDPSTLVTEFVEKVLAVDDLTVRFVLKKPVAFFPLLVATAPYTPVSPKSYPADKLDEGNTSGGVGPYRIVQWTPGVEMVLEANPNYYGTPPRTAKIIVRYLPDAATLRVATEVGDVDIAWRTLRPTDYAGMKQSSQLTVVEGPGTLIRYLCFNCKTGPFSKPVVRQAISLAVDRDYVCSTALPGCTSLYSMVPAGMWSHVDAFPQRDLAKAKSLLAQAGYSPNKKLVVDLWYSPTHYGDTEANVAAALKTALEETGLIQVDLKPINEWGDYLGYMKQGNMGTFLLGWYPDYLDPDNYTVPFARTGDSDRMGISYSNKEMDALMEKGRTAFRELHSDDRGEVYKDLQLRWTTEVPTCPLFQGTQLVVTRKGIEGVTLDVTSFLHYDTLYRE